MAIALVDEPRVRIPSAFAKSFLTKKMECATVDYILNLKINYKSSGETHYSIFLVDKLKIICYNIHTTE